jgi:hypothetical protein
MVSKRPGPVLQRLISYPLPSHSIFDSVSFGPSDTPHRPSTVLSECTLVIRKRNSRYSMIIGAHYFYMSTFTPLACYMDNMWGSGPRRTRPLLAQ